MATLLFSGRLSGKYRHTSLRHFFEVDRYHIAAMAIYGLFNKGEVRRDFLDKAYERLGISADKTSPMHC